MNVSVNLETRSGPLTGYRVVDLSTTLPGALASMFLADAHAEVIGIEPTIDSPIRQLPGWPALLRGKKSVRLDLHTAAGRERFYELLTSADVLITTARPAALARLGLSADDVTTKFPALVHAAITAWGLRSPWRDIKGYEPLVMAKMGLMHGKRLLSERPGPSYISTPYGSWGAAHTALHGILAALYERETSGLGQIVDADLLRGTASMDTYNWFFELVCQRWPDAYQPILPFTDDGLPCAPLIYPLLVAPTKDGHWLQFAAVAPQLFFALMTELDLMGFFGDPYWEGMPLFPDLKRRVELWEIMIERVAQRTLAQWQDAFAANPNLVAELLNEPPEALSHPQLVHDGRTVIVEDPDLGPVRQPSTILHVDGRPLREVPRAPRLGEHDDLLARPHSRPAVPSGPAPDDAPLAGITILELGSMFAGPYGATLLTDLGARVIKVETHDGDPIRNLVAFPEAGGARVLQGKESIAVDMSTDEGLAIVHRLAQRVDVVLQSFRAGAAERAKVDSATLRTINPELIYLNAPGYGVDGPFGARAAYAPSIGAASGVVKCDLGGVAIPGRLTKETMKSAVRIHTAAAAPSVQADGISALAVASAILTALLARKRGRPLGTVTTTMLGSTTHALLNDNVSYATRRPTTTPDPDLYGLSALYRLYETCDGWVFLAAPNPSEWDRLAEVIAPYADLAEERFATDAARCDNETALAEILASVFAKRSAAEWEQDLLAVDVGCMAVAQESTEKLLQNDEFFEAGYCVLANSPVFDEHRRLAPTTGLSRSKVKADAGCRVGQHTDAILAELGYPPEQTEDLRSRKIVSGA
jgi:crotonobetainyl-CoA:carnitine CoA-transferase CaiB-like acyl-CoA transferase